jgi:hypothetical protein
MKEEPDNLNQEKRKGRPFKEKANEGWQVFKGLANEWFQDIVSNKKKLIPAAVILFIALFGFLRGVYKALFF